MTTILCILGLLTLVGIAWWWLARDAQQSLSSDELLALLMLLSLLDE